MVEVEEVRGGRKRRVQLREFFFEVLFLHVERAKEREQSKNSQRRKFRYYYYLLSAGGARGWGEG